MKDHYPSEKFSSAVGILAASPRSIQQRIGDAFTYGLHTLYNHLDKLPEDTRAKLEQYQAAWSKVDDPHQEGLINVWAQGLSDDEATGIASWIVETAFELEREFWTED